MCVSYFRIGQGSRDMKDTNDVHVTFDLLL